MAKKQKTPTKKKAAIKAKAPAAPKGKGTTVKTARELAALRTRFAAVVGGGPVGACWFKDGGGSQQCIPATQADCKAQGGVWTPGNCPN